MTTTRREFLKSAATVAALSGVSSEKAAPSKLIESKSSTLMWYREPAVHWMDALPIGNGSIGAMIFGGIESERLQLNDDTLWSGPPQKDWNRLL